jgi:hypothetical protein
LATGEDVGSLECHRLTVAGVPGIVGDVVKRAGVVLTVAGLHKHPQEVSEQ